MCEIDMAIINTFPTLGNTEYVGWLEKDGVAGFSSEDEGVGLGDMVEDGVTLHVTCNNW
jgi:hypothetical protein